MEDDKTSQRDNSTVTVARTDTEAKVYKHNTVQIQRATEIDGLNRVPGFMGLPLSHYHVRVLLAERKLNEAQRQGRLLRGNAWWGFMMRETKMSKSEVRVLLREATDILHKLETAGLDGFIDNLLQKSQK